MLNNKCGSCKHFRFKPDEYNPRSAGICVENDIRVYRNCFACSDYVPDEEIVNYVMAPFNMNNPDDVKRLEVYKRIAKRIGL